MEGEATIAMFSPWHFEAAEQLHQLPDSIAQYGARLTAGQHQAFESMSMAEKRKKQHLAGRVCARKALKELKVDPSFEIGRGSMGEPIWPRGIVGSITHTEHIVCAAVARAIDFGGIGIDSEPVLDERVVREIAPLIALRGELARVIETAGLTPAEAVTLLFSAKESIFKCIAPLVRRYFEFTDVKIVSVDPGSGGYTARIQQALSTQFCRGAIIAGGFSFSGGQVHTHALLCR